MILMLQNRSVVHAECADMRVFAEAVGSQSPYELCGRVETRAASVGTCWHRDEVEQPMQLQRHQPCNDSEWRICVWRSKQWARVVRGVHVRGWQSERRG